MVGILTSIMAAGATLQMTVLSSDTQLCCERCTWLPYLALSQKTCRKPPR